MLLRQLHRQREHRVETDVGHNIVKSLDVEPLIQGVKMMSDAQLERPVRDRAGRLYLGSIDKLTAVNWAKESGTKLYGKEWAAYAKKKLQSSEFSHFRAEQKRKYV